MKRVILLLSVVLTTSLFVFSQETQEEKVKDKPVRSPFDSGILIDNQTSLIPTRGTLEMLIQHRFGKMNNGISDVWGIYSPGANVRMGFNYSLTDDLMIGYGLTKKNMYSDFQIKYNLLTQTRKNTIPVSVTLYGNMLIDGRNDASFGDEYKFSNRFAYFSQLIIGRKIGYNLAVQATASFTHYNKVAPDMDHDKIGIGFNARYKFSPQSAILFQYDAPLQIESISEQREFIDPPQPNFAFGYEVSTSTHSFQIYVTTADGIVPQDIYMYNMNDWRDGTKALMFGFTITRLWSF